jgi:hypothetical protein
VLASESSSAKPSPLQFTSGGRTSTPRRRHSATASATLSEFPASEVITAAMYSAG